ncbi:MAG: LysR substrate-binding domain-containing protein [Neisseria sp.]|nr:LysR substrate-binding domain-containing protein [Neisseria sp.]
MHSAIYGQLTVFHTIAAQGSISGAARQLEIGAPAVSKSLKLLEEHIGLPLFNRTTRKLELTEAGALLLARTGEAVQSLQYAVESVQDLGDTPHGSVRITVARFAYKCILKPLLAEFCRQYPEIRLEVSVFDGTVDILEQGFDLGIRFGDRVEEGMVARQLMAPFKEGLYVSQAYRDQYGLPESPADLPAHRLIGYRLITANRILPLTLDNHGQALEVDMPCPILVNDIGVMADAVRQGIGIGRLFEPVVQQYADRADFVPVLADYWQSYPGVYLYYLQNSQKAKRIRVLIDFLLAHHGG